MLRRKERKRSGRRETKTQRVVRRERCRRKRKERMGGMDEQGEVAGVNTDKGSLSRRSQR